jgi:deoxycytidylate deaminase
MYHPNLLKLIEEKPWFGHLVKEARKSEYKHKLASCLISGNKRLLAIGHNKIRYHRLGHRWNPYPHSLHSEVATIVSVDKSRIRNAILYVLRLNNQNKPMLARPCPDCMKLIVWIGTIKKIIYSIDDYPYYKEEKV